MLHLAAGFFKRNLKRLGKHFSCVTVLLTSFITCNLILRHTLLHAFQWLCALITTFDQPVYIMLIWRFCGFPRITFSFTVVEDDCYMKASVQCRIVNYRYLLLQFQTSAPLRTRNTPHLLWTHSWCKNTNRQELIQKGHCEIIHKFTLSSLV